MKNLLLCLFLLAAAARAEAAELLIFTAEWCGPCQLLKADHAADPTLFDNYTWGYVDFDAEKELVQMYGVRTVPTFLILERNTVVRQQVGYQGPEKLKNWLKGTQPRRFRRSHVE